MAQPSGPDTQLALTLFLQACVERGVIPLEVAERLDRFRRVDGPDLLRALQELGIPAPAAPAPATAPAPTPAAPTPPAADGNGYQPQLLDGGAHPGLTFETFVSVRANAFALEAAKAVVKPGGAPAASRAVYVAAGEGMGKTHLLSAIANAAAGRRALFVNTGDLGAEFDRARRMQAEADLCRVLSTAELLLLDDFQLCAGHEAVQRGLFTCLEQLERRGRVAVVAANVPPPELRGVESRLLSRLQGAIVVSLQMGERAERAEILRRALAPGVLAEDVIGWVADQQGESVRALIAAGRQLLAQQELTGTPAAVPPAAGRKRAARPAAAPEPTPEPAPEPAAREPEADPTPWAARFKGMLTAAQTEDEQAMALQMAVAERLRQLRKEGAEPELVRRFTEALDLLSAGRPADAVQRIFM